MSGLVQLGTPALVIVLRTVIVYFAVLAGMRLAGKREIGQLTPFDLVLVLLIANAVQNAMVGSDTSLLGGLIAAATLLGVNYAVGHTAIGNRLVRRWLLGKPRILAENGAIDEEAMKRESVSEEELLAAMREHGIDDIADVELAVLEIDGTVSIVPLEKGKAHSHRRHVRQVRHGQ